MAATAATLDDRAITVRGADDGTSTGPYTKSRYAAASSAGIRFRNATTAQAENRACRQVEGYLPCFRFVDSIVQLKPDTAHLYVLVKPNATHR